MLDSILLHYFINMPDYRPLSRYDNLNVQNKAVSEKFRANFFLYCTMKRFACVTKRHRKRPSVEPEPIVKHATDNTTQERQQVNLTAFCTHQKEIMSDNSTKERHKLLVILPSY